METCEYCTQEATVRWPIDGTVTDLCNQHGTMVDDVVCGWPWNAGKASAAAAEGMGAPETPEMGAFFDKLREAIRNLPDDPSGLEADTAETCETCGTEVGPLLGGREYYCPQCKSHNARREPKDG